MTVNDLWVLLGWITIVVVVGVGLRWRRTKATRPALVVGPVQPPGNHAQGLQEGGLLLGEYREERELGEGGMGRVVLVKSIHTGALLAMKQSKRESDQQLLQELRVWVQLAPHPNVTACHFVATINDRPCIFAEYVAGGSLDQALAEGAIASLHVALDLAIQTAWGIHAIHIQGLVHQDIKPANVLLSIEGITKITDVGIARAVSKEEGSAPFAGSTRAYRSPEQQDARAQQGPKRVTHATDIWSWGLLSLELCLRERTWGEGSAAAAVLEEALREQRVPGVVGEVLARCFLRDPSSRWSSMLEAANAMNKAYDAAVGVPYTRPQPIFPDPAPRRDRRAPNLPWKPASQWLTEAAKLAGLPSRTSTSDNVGGPTLREVAMAELASFQQALEFARRAPGAGSPMIALWLADLVTDKASAHEESGDLAGAVACLGEGITRLQSLRHDGTADGAIAQAQLLMNRARAERKLGSIQASLGSAAAACELLEGLSRTRVAAIEIVARLARALTLLGGLQLDAGRSSHARTTMELAFSHWKKLPPGFHEDDQEATLIAFAAVLRRSGSGPERSRAVDILGEVVERRTTRWKETGSAAAESLCRGYVNLALAIEGLDQAGARGLLAQAVSMRHSLVSEGHGELRPMLAGVLLSLAMLSSQDMSEAKPLVQESLALYQRLVVEEGRTELRGSLLVAQALNSLLSDGPDASSTRTSLSALAIAASTDPMLAQMVERFDTLVLSPIRAATE